MKSRPEKLHAARPEKGKIMKPEMETPARLADATGAKIETAGFVNGQYPVRDHAATPFGTAALRIAHLVSRHGVAVEQAAMLAALIYGEARP